MNVQLSPELEALVMKDVERGPYHSVEDYLEHAVTMLHEQEEQLAVNRDQLRAAIEEGWAEAERGEFVSGDQVKRDMSAMKSKWLAERKSA
jgi:putative addiction module CopG family antidote